MQEEDGAQGSGAGSGLGGKGPMGCPSAQGILGRGPVCLATPTCNASLRPLEGSLHRITSESSL
ncbi:hypothetical protein EYF80_000613 [Liparis tanakae]|uniref:Uncharacterized protein n=1 Tax=Liparis tanakae TaxID=230148 RepID=A0A4Z2JGF4_9TELE|nr:hypothetical protein EYF80_000613 [Liparis tanakae]